MTWCTLVLCGLGVSAAVAQTAAALPVEVVAEVQRLAGEAAAHLLPATAAATRIEVQVGRLDPQLNLAPCQQIVAFLPPGIRPLGRLRMGLRCAKGAMAWRVTLPVDVKVWGPAVVVRSALPAGTVLLAQHLDAAEVDLAARSDAAIAQPADALGRTLVRGLASGDAVRSGDLKVRQYFNAGDTVRVKAIGPGFAVLGEGQAMAAGLEGRTIQVRLEGGRVISGVAAGERLIEVLL